MKGSLVNMPTVTLILLSIVVVPSFRYRFCNGFIVPSSSSSLLQKQKKTVYTIPTTTTVLNEKGKINSMQDLSSSKVVTQDEISKDDKKKIYCRCWQSKTFPLCDGQHMKHNKETGDNVGPLILSVSKSADAQKEEKEKTVDKKTAGRKKRVIVGYSLMTLIYLLSAITTVQKAIAPGMITNIYLSSFDVLMAGVSYIMISASQNDRLNSDTYKRLNLSNIMYGLVVVTTACLQTTTSFRQYDPKLIIPSLIVVINSIKGYSYGVLGWDKQKDKPITSLLTDISNGITSTFKGLFLTKPENLKSFLYLISTYMILFLGTSNSPASLTCSNIVSALPRYGRLAFFSTVLYTLKDAADRKRLNGTTFIQLNLLSSIVFGTMALFLKTVLLPTKTGVIWLGITGSASFFSIFTTMVGLSSYLNKKKKESK